MARETSTNLAEVLTAFKTRLIDQIADASSHNTYLSTLPDELPPSPDELMFEISPSTNWQFEQGQIVGGGQNMLHVMGQILITCHITQQKDEVGRDSFYLTHETLGVSPLLKLVLKALSVHDLADPDGDLLLSHPIHPSSIVIRPKDDRSRGYVTLALDVEFDWDMT